MDTVITTPLGEFTGVDRSGLPVQPKYAAMQTFGIKARPVDLELEAQRRGAQEQALVNSIAAEVRSMARLHQRGAVTDRMMEETSEKAREKIERRGGEAREVIKLRWESGEQRAVLTSQVNRKRADLNVWLGKFDEEIYRIK